MYCCPHTKDSDAPKQTDILLVGIPKPNQALEHHIPSSLLLILSPKYVASDHTVYNDRYTQPYCSRETRDIFWCILRTEDEGPNDTANSPHTDLYSCCNTTFGRTSYVVCLIHDYKRVVSLGPVGQISTIVQEVGQWGKTNPITMRNIPIIRTAFGSVNPIRVAPTIQQR